MHTRIAVALEKSIKAINNTPQSDISIEDVSILIPIENVVHYSGGEFVNLSAGVHYYVGKDLNEYEAASIVKCGRAAIIRTPGCHVYMTIKALDTLMGRA